MSEDYPENSVIDRRYQVIDCLGEGGMGVVYSCIDLQNGEKRAVKLLREALLDNEKSLKRFDHEYKVLARLDHPNIVRCLGHGSDEGRPYLVMELFVDAEGKPITLANLWAEHEDRKMGAELLALLAPQIISAVAALHEMGVVHRDLKPENVLLTVGEDGHWQVKLSDFGLIALDSENAHKWMMVSISLSQQVSKDKDKAMVGTYSYMSPEQKRGDAVDARSDVYSLGLMLYRLATGYERISFRMPGDVNPELPGWLDKVILACVDEEPGNRADSASKLLRLLPVADRRERRWVFPLTTIASCLVMCAIVCGLRYAYIGPTPSDQIHLSAPVSRLKPANPPVGKENGGAKTLPVAAKEPEVPKPPPYEGPTFLQPWKVPELGIRLVPVRPEYARRRRGRFIGIKFPFWIADSEVSRKQFELVTGEKQASRRMNLPMVGVTRKQAMEFARRLNDREAARLPLGYQYRLPTDMEWEVCCFADGKSVLLNLKNKSNKLEALKGNLCHFYELGPVLSTKPNEWGLYNMVGNAREHVLDQPQDDTFPDDVGSPVGRFGPKGIGVNMRTSEWWARRKDDHDMSDVGFRVVLAPEIRMRNAEKMVLVDPEEALMSELKRVNAASMKKGVEIPSSSSSFSKFRDLSPLRRSCVERVYLMNSEISELPDLSKAHIKYLDISFCPRLKEIGPLNTHALSSLNLCNLPIGDLNFLKDASLEKSRIEVSLCDQPIDLAALSGKKIPWLELNGVKVDLSQLKGCEIGWLTISGSDISSCAALADMKIDRLSISRIPVVELPNLEGLNRLSLDRCTKLVRLPSCKSLTSLYVLGGTPFPAKLNYPSLRSLSVSDIRTKRLKLVGMPRLKYLYLNRGTVEKVEIHGATITNVNFTDCPELVSISKCTKLSSVWVKNCPKLNYDSFAGAPHLNLQIAGDIRDTESLIGLRDVKQINGFSRSDFLRIKLGKGLPRRYRVLYELVKKWNSVATIKLSISPYDCRKVRMELGGIWRLRKMTSREIGKIGKLKLDTLKIRGNYGRVGFAAAFRWLRELDISGSKVSDLTDVAKMNISCLDISNTKVRTLAPLKGKRLRRLSCRNTAISDISPLNRMTFGELDLRGTEVVDFTPLLKMEYFQKIWLPKNKGNWKDVRPKLRYLKEIDGVPIKKEK